MKKARVLSKTRAYFFRLVDNKTDRLKRADLKKFSLSAAIILPG